MSASESAPSERAKSDAETVEKHFDFCEGGARRAHELPIMLIWERLMMLAHDASLHARLQTSGRASHLRLWREFSDYAIARREHFVGSEFAAR